MQCKVWCGHLLLGPGAQELLAHVVVAGLYCAEERDAAAGVLLQSEVIRRVEQQHLHYLQHGNHVNILTQRDPSVYIFIKETHPMLLFKSVSVYYSFCIFMQHNWTVFINCWINRNKNVLHSRSKWSIFHVVNIATRQIDHNTFTSYHPIYIDINASNMGEVLQCISTGY